MPVIYIAYAAQDRPFVEDRLIRPLPALGFDRWLSSGMLEQNVAAAPSVALAMQQSAAILLVVSASALASPHFVAEVEAALACKPIVIAVYLGGPDVAGHNQILRELKKVAGINVTEAMDQFEPRNLWHRLAELLPRPDSVQSPGELDKVATLIDWNEEVFSDRLKEAVGRNDFNRSEALVGGFSDHITNRPYPYAANHARTDLRTLRSERQFLLMRSYASAALASGTTDFEVRRQYAQALIELKHFRHAERVLVPLINEATEANDKERFEARGLLGRLYKQRYVDSGKPGDGRFLTQAIEAYRLVFEEDEKHVWHGVNAASCILRANRDGIQARPVEQAHDIARRVLNVLRRREAEHGSLEVWDLASRVEALVDLNEFEQASVSLEEYLTHPDMKAFEVSSTYRQFDEVLQLGKDSRGAELLHRLAKAAERYRTGGLSQLADKGARPMLIRVSDPQWAPKDIPDLVIDARLGTVLSISASDRTIRALLKDPVVIGMEESRPSGQIETTRSLPFIGVAAQYQGPAGPYSEDGRAALVAIIDNGIDVLHETFLDDNMQSRIIGIWDQQDDDPAATPPTGFTFGRFHTEAEIAGYVAAKKVPASLRRWNEGHGTHVASIAAGRKVGNFAGGVAPAAQLLIVISRGDESTGYSKAHLAALDFIDQKAASLNKPVVVNLSQGMNAGAHDGKSSLEVAFDNFANGTKPGRVVVKSAGNERGKRGHAKLTIPAGGAERLAWRCPPQTSHVRIELWWTSANTYRFQLKSPSGDLSPWVVRTNSAPTTGIFANHGPFELTFVERFADNGDSKLTIETSDGVSLKPTEWELDIEALQVPAQGDIHAWIERGGYAPIEFVTHDSEEMTLSIPGTARNVITVGAIDANKPIRVGAFSSYGPTRDNRDDLKPDISAPGVQVKAARRDTAQDVIAMDGTSMAAPHVTGAIALVLSKTARAGGLIPAATQIGAVLRQKTQNYSSRWDRGQGYGVLDVAALLDAF